MNRQFRFCFHVCFLAMSIGGCTSLNTEFAISGKPLPERYKNQPKNKHTVANINWREYFSDARLVSLIDIAVRNNPNLQIAMQRIEISRAAANAANAALLPQVGLNLGGGVQKFGLYTMDGAGNASTEIRPGQTVPVNYTDVFVGLQSSWEIDIWGKLESQRKSAAAQYLSSIEGANLVVSNLVSDIAVYYNELLALDHRLDIVRQTIEKQREGLQIIEVQKLAGRANELAVRQFRAQLLDTQALERNIFQQIADTENKINFLLGRYPQPIERAKGAFYNDIPREVSSGIPSQLLTQRPDIREAELLVEASHFDVQAAKAAFFPNLNITATLGYQAFNPEFLFASPASLAYSFVGNMVAPLINREALKARFDSAKANQRTALYQYQRTILNAYSEVATQLSNMKNLQQIGVLKKRQTEVLKLSVEASNELYKSARASYLEVLIAQQSALQSNLELIDVMRQQRLATISIYKALGGGWK